MRIWQSFTPDMNKSYAPFTTTETQLDERTRRYTLRRSDQALTYGEWLEELVAHAEFRRDFNAVLCQSSFEAFFFETPPVTFDSQSAPFEWVLVDGAPLQRMRPEPTAFEQYFRPGEGAVAFANLGGDAQLVAPALLGDPENYVHLANFVRRGSASQIDQFWQLTARTCSNSVGKQPLWLSTSGLGIGWLHLRLDTRPKYYNHTPYTRR